MKPLKAGQLATLINKERLDVCEKCKKKKLKPGQLCTIIDKRTGDRYVFQAQRYDGRAYGICIRCQWENYIFSMSCPADCLKMHCSELFGSETYPKIIKYVKNS